jgi:hypothetical protein
MSGSKELAESVRATLSTKAMTRADRMSSQLAIEVVRHKLQTIYASHPIVVTTVYPEPFAWVEERGVLRAAGPIAADSLGNAFVIDGTKLIFVNVLKGVAKATTRLRNDRLGSASASLFVPEHHVNDQNKKTHHPGVLLVASAGALLAVVNPHAAKPEIKELHVR